MSIVEGPVEGQGFDRMLRFKHCSILALLAVLTLVYPSTLAQELVTNTYFVNHESTEPFYAQHNLDPNVVIHVREVVMSGRERTAPTEGKVLLLLPGGTGMGYVVYDLPCEGCSMMRDFAQAGWDVFTLDFEGYGHSTRPLIMEDWTAFPESKGPMDVEVLVAGVARVVEFISSLRNVENVHVFGWSQAATCEAPRYAGEHPDKVAKLVLFGGGYQSLGEVDGLRAEVESWVNEEKVFVDSPMQGGFFGTPDEALLPGFLEAMRAAVLASDPRSGEFGGRVREPTGRYGDLAHLPCFEAERITMPTLVIRGELDTYATQEDSQLLLEALGSEVKEYVEIANAGHLIPWEQTNREFFAAVRAFLEAE